MKRLRNKAEKLIDAAHKKNDTNLSNDDVQMLLHELEVHQVELEMQNDELRISHNELERSRAEFASLFDLAPIGYFVLDSAGLIVESNRFGVGLLSPSHGVKRKRFLSFIEESYRDTFYKFFRQISLSDRTQSCEVQLESKLSPLFVRLDGVKVKDLNETVKYYIAVIDLTERKKAEIVLQQTKESLELALKGSDTGTWSMDLSTGLMKMDQFTEHIFGFDKGMFSGKYRSFLELVIPEDREELEKNFNRSIRKRSPLNVEFRILWRNSNIHYISARGHVVTTIMGDVRLAGIVTDITEKKHLEAVAILAHEASQKRVLSAAIQAQESERKRISEALHDSVGQLLYAIKISVDQIKNAGTNSKAFIHAGELINQAIKETRNISFELTPSILADFGLEAALEEIIKRFNSPQLKLSISTSGLRKQRINPEVEITVFRIIQELVNNIVKHSLASEGHIEVSRKKDAITIIVSDNGIGLDPQNKSITKGNGLASIKNRLSLFNGSMVIERLKPGTRFILDLKEGR
jgi:PAS domain S-box-containing protein